MSQPPESSGASFYIPKLAKVRLLYDGNHVVEERSTKTGATYAEYVWSPTDGSLILRDMDVDGTSETSLLPEGTPGTTGLEERLYALPDVRGTVNTITDAGGGTVLERYVYNADGLPDARQYDWSDYTLGDMGRNSGSSRQDRQLAPRYSRWGWQYLFSGMRFEIQPARYVTTQNDKVAIFAGLYDAGGDGFYNPREGRTLQPDAQAAAHSYWNAYNPVPTYLQWQIGATTAAIVGLSIAAAVATGGYAVGLAPALGLGTLVAGGGVELSLGGTMMVGAVAGASGNLVMGLEEGYSRHGDWGEAWKSGGIYALAGAVGGAAGGAAGYGAGTYFTCARVGATGAGFMMGAAEGTAFGATEGLIRGGLTKGTWKGARSAALEGAIFGGAIGGGLGALAHKLCFVAGTPIVVDVNNEVASDNLTSLAKEPDVGGSATSATSTRLRYISKPIEKIVEEFASEPQVVVSRNEFDPVAPLVKRRVIGVKKRVAYSLQHLKVECGAGNIETIQVTGEHPFFVVNRGWLSAAELIPGDRLISAAEETPTVVANAAVLRPDGVAVFNFEVESSHTYFVGSEKWGFSVWAHNTYTDPAYLTGRLDENGRYVLKYGAAENVSGEVVQWRLKNPRVSADRNVVLIKYEDAAGNMQTIIRPSTSTRTKTGFNSIHGEDNAFPVLQQAVEDGNFSRLLEVYSEYDFCPRCYENYMSNINPNEVRLSYSMPYGFRGHADWHYSLVSEALAAARR